jgi:hypothetical protein
VLVVLVVVDVIADVVEQRRIGENLPLLRLASQPSADGIEQLQCQPLDAGRVRLLVMRPLGELLH